MNLAHDALMLDDAASVLATQRDQDRRSRGLPIGCDSGGGTSRTIQIGDNTHYHYQQTAARGGLGTLGKLAVGTALALGTGGAGLGLWSALRPVAEKTVEKVLRGDASLEVGEPIIRPPPQ